MELFRELAVSINGLDDIKGTGCIYSSSNETGINYVITAQHCLSKDREKRVFTNEEIKEIKIYDFNKEQIHISKIHSPQNIDLDFAIIEVNLQKKYRNVSIKIPERGMKYTLFGFPKYLSEDTDPGELLEGHISEIKKHTITLQHEYGVLSDADNDALNNTVGFSGSGMYFEEDNTFYLIGILIKLRGEGTHGKLIGININEVNKFLLESGLKRLSPYELSDFKLHLKLLLEEEDEKLRPILKRRFESNISELTPMYIQEKLKGKIFLPYNDEENILNKKLWEGWLRFLLYISLSNGETLNIQNINEHVVIEEPTASKKRFYFTKEKRMASFVSKLYGPSYNDIQNNDLIFVNSEEFRGNKTPTFEDIHQIIKNITNPYLFENGIDISNPNELKKVKVIHLDYLIDQIENELLSCLNSNKSLTEIEFACIKCLETMFKDFESFDTEKEILKIETNNT